MCSEISGHRGAVIHSFTAFSHAAVLATYRRPCEWSPIGTILGPDKCELAMSNNVTDAYHAPTSAPVQQELLSQTPPPASASSCGGMSTTSLRWSNIGSLDLNFETDEERCARHSR